MKFRIIVLLTLITAMTAASQEKRLTAQDVIPGGKNYARFTPKSLRQLTLAGDNYVYRRGDTLLITRPGSDKPRTWVTLDMVNTALEKAGLKSLKSLPGVSVEESDGTIRLYFSAHSGVNLYNPATGEIEFRIPYLQGDSDFAFEPQQKRLGVTHGRDFVVIDSEGHRTIVGHDDNDQICFGASDVHRNEFGIHSGIFWSPAGNAVAFYRMDESNVTDYPLVDISTRTATLKNDKYPMAGMSSHEVKVGIYHTGSGDTLYLRTPGAKDQYLTNIAWSPDEKHIYLQRLNRAQDTCHNEVYDAATGRLIRTLFVETSDKYFEPQHPVFFLPGHDDKFVHFSRRNGYHHLYLYNTEGKLLKQLTDGEWEVLSAQPSPDGKSIFITSTEASPLEVNLYKVSVSTGKRTRLTPQPGVHNTQISTSGRYILDVYSNHETPRVIQLIRSSNGKSETLLTAPNPYEGYAAPSVVSGTIKAADGVTDLYYRVTRPPHFDAGKKYPVIVYVYGGPHAQMVTDRWLWGASGNDMMMANRGYVVFTLDNRGSANRGLPFESVIYRNLGVNEMEDQMCGVKWLLDQPWCDAERIGVHGWSYGGFMTTNLMLNHGDIFKVGVAGGAVIDWKYYEVMYGERYMDTPQENPEGYKDSNLCEKAGNLQGHLLLVHCDTDPVVVWQHTLSFLKSCIKAGTYPDYFVYPGHGHNVIGPERVHLYEKITRYFDDYLK
ncbi:MAG: DPP IV N-terminal domain-containing protein [Coprobacter sp.]|nr:DPP IV N-terminal domain-containing protein [Coprobacter sp.]